MSTPQGAIDADELTETRRHLHAHPELSNQEYETAAFIRERLSRYGIERIENVAETGVVAIVEGAPMDRRWRGAPISTRSRSRRPAKLRTRVRTLA